LTSTIDATNLLKENRIMSGIAQQVTKEGVLVGRQTWDMVSPEYQANIVILVERVNKLIATYPGPIKINDGLRRPQDKPKKRCRHVKALCRRRDRFGRR
jgi:dihydrofolate reductase